jgi:hypothetical protein
MDDCVRCKRTFSNYRTGDFQDRMPTPHEQRGRNVPGRGWVMERVKSVILE